MYLKFVTRHIVLFLAVLVLLFTSGCGSGKKALPQESATGFSVRSGKMLHVKQVLEHYDASGQPVPQYFEMWFVDKRGLCVELNGNGNETGRILDMDDMHIAYDSKTRIAVKHDFSRIFILNFESLRSACSNVVQADDQRYAGRICAIYLLENDDSEEWIKVYVDRETGYVLLCDAPLFRIRTALFEVLPMDNRLFKAPSDIVYK